MLKRLLFACLFFAAVPAFAQDGITTGALECLPTDGAMSLTAAFSGDANGNATAVVEFKAQSSGTWLTAYAPYIDRRGGVYPAEARGPVVGLTPNTAYDCRITWTDSDGVTGTNPVTGTFTTHPLTPTVAAGTCTATTEAELNTCITGGSLGTIAVTADIDLAAQITLSNGGASATAYRKIECAAGVDISTMTATLTRAFQWASNFWWIDRCTFPALYGSAVTSTGTRQGFYFTNNDVQDIAGGCESGATGSGIALVATSTDVFIIGNNLTGSLALLSSDTDCTKPTPSESPGLGVSFPGDPSVATTVVIKNNRIRGALRDGISASNSNMILINVDIRGNFVGMWDGYDGYKDDGIDTKGRLRGVRVWENHVVSGLTIGGTNYGPDCIASNTNNIGSRFDGPYYAFRNSCYPQANAQSGGRMFKSGGVPSYFFHNSLLGDLKPSSSSGWGFLYCEPTSVGATQCPLMTALNNAAYTGEHIYQGWRPGSTADYNIVDVKGSRNFYENWNGSAPASGNFAGWQTCPETTTEPCKDLNGKESNPDFTWNSTSGELQITSMSPAYEAGTPIANFNCATAICAWQYSGSAPDAGAFIVGGSTPPTLTTVSPNFDTQGETAAVTLTGTGFEGTDMGASTTVSVSGTGITQDSLSVVSDTSITVNFVIAADATASARDVIVTTDEGTSNSQTFTVVASGGAPTFSSIAPASGRLGTIYTVTLTGTDFNVGGGTITEACPGIAFSSIVVVGATTITAVVTVDIDAPVTACSVTVTTDNGQSNPQTFTTTALGLAPAGKLIGRGGR